MKPKAKTTPKAKPPTLVIGSCKNCPFFEERRHYTEDDFELAHDWFCKKKGGKEIAGYVGWNEEKRVAVPNWCPLRK